MAQAVKRNYDAVLFDLLSALIDSWSLWDDLAGNSDLGRNWRMHYLNATSRAGKYIPYLSLVGDSAEAVGIPRSHATELATRWNELTPWPEASLLVAKLASKTKVGVVTNCSEKLGHDCAKHLRTPFDVVVTAERVGYYKPHQKIYQEAIAQIGTTPERILYVAGSPFDVLGASAAGMPTYWHNRIGLIDNVASSLAIESSATLDGVCNLIV